MNDLMPHIITFAACYQLLRYSTITSYTNESSLSQTSLLGSVDIFASIYLSFPIPCTGWLQYIDYPIRMALSKMTRQLTSQVRITGSRLFMLLRLSADLPDMHISDYIKHLMLHYKLLSSSKCVIGIWSSDRCTEGYSSVNDFYQNCAEPQLQTAGVIVLADTNLVIPRWLRINVTTRRT